MDAKGETLFVDDIDNRRIRAIDMKSGIIRTVAGNGSAQTSGDDGPGAQAGVPFPTGLAVDAFGNALVSTNGAPEIIPSSAPTYSDNRVRSVLAIASHGVVAGGSPPSLRGDVNGDGSVSLQDALRLLRHIVGINEDLGYNPDNADVNADHAVNLADARLILQQLF
jgi:hypothetical protein